MNFFKKPSLITTLIYMLLAFGMVGLWSCEQEEGIFENSHAEYLTLDSYEISEMSEQDFQTMFKAIERMDVRQKHGLYQVKQTSGAQINISEELFVFIKNGFDYSNKPFSPNQTSKKSKSFKFPLLRLQQTTPENGQDGGTPTDCMAHAIAAMAGKPLTEVKNWLEGTYGSDGVPLESFQAACANFAPGGTYGQSGYNLPNGNLNNTVIVINNGTHSVNAKYYDSSSGVIIYEDNQAGYYGNGAVTGYVYPSQVSRFYSKD